MEVSSFKLIVPPMSLTLMEEEEEPEPPVRLTEPGLKLSGEGIREALIESPSSKTVHLMVNPKSSPRLAVVGEEVPQQLMQEAGRLPISVPILPIEDGDGELLRELESQTLPVRFTALVGLTPVRIMWTTVADRDAVIGIQILRGE